MTCCWWTGESARPLRRVGRGVGEAPRGRTRTSACISRRSASRLWVPSPIRTGSRRRRTRRRLWPTTTRTPAHITADVATVGLTASIFTLEGSVFHGQEPDENRWDMRSGEARLLLGPGDRASLARAVGAKFHRPPGAPGGDRARRPDEVHRLRDLPDDDPGGFFAATAIAGKTQDPEGPWWGYTLEWTWKFARVNFLYGRVERVDGRRLRARPQSSSAPRRCPARPHLRPGGDARVRPRFPVVVGGGDRTGDRLHFLPLPFSRFDSVYGSHPISFHGFLRIRFGSHAGMEHNPPRRRE